MTEAVGRAKRAIATEFIEMLYIPWIELTEANQ
jgi:hypothetical protein